MKRILTLSILFAGFALVLTGRLAATTASAPVRAETTRTVYLAAVDAKGVAITDLTAADLTIKEGGKDRTVGSLKAATAPLQVVILVDDGGTGGFQGGVAAFINGTGGHAQYAISLMNPQPQRIANFIEDVDGLKAAIARLSQRGKINQDGEQLIEAISGAAKELQQRKAARPVILALTTGGEPVSSDMADEALNVLKNTGANLHALYITGLTVGRVLVDGTKQSGGTIQQAGNGTGINEALGRVASNLMHQYVLTYTLPDGTKPSEKLQLATTRKGITLLAPSRIPDK